MASPLDALFEDEELDEIEQPETTIAPIPTGKYDAALQSLQPLDAPPAIKPISTDAATAEEIIPSKTTVPKEVEAKVETINKQVSSGVRHRKTKPVSLKEAEVLAKQSKYTIKTLHNAFKEARELTYMGFDISRIDYKIMTGTATKADIAKADSMRAEVARRQERIQNDPFMAKAFGMIEPSIEKSMIQAGAGGLIGATVFGTGFFLATLATPVPDDLLLPVTLPAITSLGASFGAMFTPLEDGRKIEAGSQYRQMIDAGVSHNIAASVGQVYGMLSTGAEMAELSALSRFIPGGKKFVNTAVSKAIDKAVKKMAQYKVPNVAGKMVAATVAETTVEASQELMANITEEIGLEFSDKLNKTDLAPKDIKEFTNQITKNVLETIKVTGAGMGVSAVALGGANIMAKGAAKAAVNALPEEPTVDELKAAREKREKASDVPPKETIKDKIKKRTEKDLGINKEEGVAEPPAKPTPPPESIPKPPEKPAEPETTEPAKPPVTEGTDKKKPGKDLFKDKTLNKKNKKPITKKGKKRVIEKGEPSPLAKADDEVGWHFGVGEDTQIAQDFAANNGGEVNQYEITPDSTASIEDAGDWTSPDNVLDAIDKSIGKHGEKNDAILKDLRDGIVPIAKEAESLEGQALVEASTSWPERIQEAFKDTGVDVFNYKALETGENAVMILNPDIVTKKGGSTKTTLSKPVAWNKLGAPAVKDKKTGKVFSVVPRREYQVNPSKYTEAQLEALKAAKKKARADALKAGVSPKDLVPGFITEDMSGFIPASVQSKKLGDVEAKTSQVQQADYDTKLTAVEEKERTAEAKLAEKWKTPLGKLNKPSAAHRLVFDQNKKQAESWARKWYRANPNFQKYLDVDDMLQMAQEHVWKTVRSFNNYKLRKYLDGNKTVKNKIGGILNKAAKWGSLNGAYDLLAEKAGMTRSQVVRKIKDGTFVMPVGINETVTSDPTDDSTAKDSFAKLGTVDSAPDLLAGLVGNDAIKKAKENRRKKELIEKHKAAKSKRILTPTEYAKEKEIEDKISAEIEKARKDIAELTKLAKEMDVTPKEVFEEAKREVAAMPIIPDKLPKTASLVAEAKKTVEDLTEDEYFTVDKRLIAPSPNPVTKLMEISKVANEKLRAAQAVVEKQKDAAIVKAIANVKKLQGKLAVATKAKKKQAAIDKIQKELSEARLIVHQLQMERVERENTAKSEKRLRAAATKVSEVAAMEVEVIKTVNEHKKDIVREVKKRAVSAQEEWGGRRDPNAKNTYTMDEIEEPVIKSPPPKVKTKKATPKPAPVDTSKLADKFKVSENKPTPEAIKGFKDSVLKSKKTKTAVAWIANNSANKSFSTIAKRILPYLKDVDIVVVDPGVSVSEGIPASLGHSYGVYYVKNNKETIYLKSDKFGKESGVTEVTVLHEAIHAATAKKIRIGNKVKNKGTDLYNAVQDLYTLQHYVVKAIDDKVKNGTATKFEKKLTTLMSISQVDELVAHGFVDKKFQEVLKGIEYTQNKSAWSKFVKTIAKILGLKGTTVLDKVISLTDEIIAADTPVESKQSQVNNVLYSGLDPTLMKSMLLDPMNSLLEKWVTNNVDKIGAKASKALRDKVLKRGWSTWLAISFGENFGLDQSFLDIKEDFKNALGRWETISSGLAESINKIDTVFNTATGSKKFKPAAVDKRARQIAGGSITSYAGKTFKDKVRIKRLENIVKNSPDAKAVKRANAELDAIAAREALISDKDRTGKFDAAIKATKNFAKLEKMLKERGLLQDHQFARLSNKELAKAVGTKDKNGNWNQGSLQYFKEERDRLVKEFANLDPKDPHLKNKQDDIIGLINTNEQHRIDLTTRLQIHYKNAGKSYLRLIYDKVRQQSNSISLLDNMALDKKWALRRDNWEVDLAGGNSARMGELVEIIKNPASTPEQVAVAQTELSSLDAQSDGVVIVKHKGKPMSSKSAASTAKMVHKGITAEARDAYLTDFFQKIVDNKEWSNGTKKKEGYTMIPKEERWHNLQGIYVKTPIYKNLVETYRSANKFELGVREFMSYWKMGKVVYSTAAQARNLLSNFILSDFLADVGLAQSAKELPFSLNSIRKLRDHEYRTTDPIEKAFKLDTTLMKSTWAKNEIEEQFYKRFDFTQEGVFFKGTDVGTQTDKTLRMIGKILKAGPNTYSLVEEGMKYTIFKVHINRQIAALQAEAAQSGGIAPKSLDDMTAVERKKIIREAEKKANYALFDYGDVPSGIRMVRIWYSPFVTFMYKAIPRLAWTSLRKPWKAAKYMMMTYAIQAGMTALWDDDSEKKREMEERNLPHYVARDMLPGGIPGQHSHLRLPWKDKYGRTGYFDLSFILPWGEVTEGSWFGGSVNIGTRSFLPNNPILNLYSDLKAEQNIFLHKPLWYEHETALEKTGAAFIYASQVLFEPGILRSGRIAYEKIVRHPKDYRGRRNSIGEVMADQFIGLKVRRFSLADLTVGRQREISKTFRSINDEASDKINAVYIQTDLPGREKAEKVREIINDMNSDLNRTMDKAYYYMGVDKHDRK